MEPISVVVPVGSDPIYLEYLPECMESILNQTQLPSEIILIDDGAEFEHLGNRGSFPVNGLMCVAYDYDFPNSHLRLQHNGKFYKTWYDFDLKIEYKLFITPWNVGVADAFNFGVALSANNLVFMIGSDDIMQPTCLEECVKAYDKHQIEGWYQVKYQVESGDIFTIPNNTAMVTKKLWQELGGFPPSAGVGACDALLLSIMLKHMPERIIGVISEEPLCWLREGDHQDTRKNGWLFADEIVSIRSKETDRWRKQN